jgi:hypothetical protein
MPEEISLPAQSLPTIMDLVIRVWRGRLSGPSAYAFYCSLKFATVGLRIESFREDYAEASR